MLSTDASVASAGSTCQLPRGIRLPTLIMRNLLYLSPSFLLGKVLKYVAPRHFRKMPMPQNFGARRQSPISGRSTCLKLCLSSKSSQTPIILGRHHFFSSMSGPYVVRGFGQDPTRTGRDDRAYWHRGVFPAAPSSYTVQATGGHLAMDFESVANGLGCLKQSHSAKSPPLSALGRR